MTNAVALDAVSKSYRSPATEFVALRDVLVRFDQGEFVAVVGKSGSGKSTLLNLVAGLDPSAGSVTVADTRLAGLDEGRLSAWRGRSGGIVFQFFQLLLTLRWPRTSCSRWTSLAAGRPTPMARWKQSHDLETNHH